MPDNCPVCDKPLSTHPDGLACCPAGCDGCRCLCGEGRMMHVHCSDCGWTTEYGTREEVTGWWNARASHAETLALMARVKELEDAARGGCDAMLEALIDMWQTLRVNERNLSGIDPNRRDDTPRVPATPNLVHRAGLDETYRVHERLRAAYAIMSRLLPEPKEPAHD